MNPRLRVLKTWLDKDFALIFQVQIIAEKGLYPKKSHLLLDLRQQSFGVSLGADKPAQASANAAFIQVLRKQLPSFTIKELLLEATSGDIWIPLYSGANPGPPWVLRLTRSRPPLASLIDPELTAHVSYGQKGTFTKKHKEASGLPEAGLQDILPKLMSGLQVSDSIQDEDEKSADEDATSDESQSPLSQAQRLLISRLKRKQKTTRKNLEKLEKDLPDLSVVKEAERSASLLQSFAYLVKPNAHELRLDPAQTGEDPGIVLPLDPDLSVGKNIEEAFDRSRKLKKKRAMGSEQVQQSQDLLASLETDLDILRKEPATQVAMEQLVRKYRLPDLVEAPRGASGESSAKPYKTYIASTGHSILVGKGAAENDELTKAARSNDYWFHAVGVTGSHVIVPMTADLRSGVPANLLKEASMLALYFSKRKGELTGECYVTRKAHIKKPKGMPLGLWRIDQSETFIVRYTDADLQKVLQTLKA